MKKFFKLIIVLFIALSLVSCAKTPDNSNNENSDFVWTRVGTYEDETGATLMVSKSETEGYEGWSVGYYTQDESYGWIIQQEGNTLHGDLLGYEEGSEYIVTVSEEGEDGLLLVTPDAVEHHFKPMDLPEVIGSISINIDGFGQIEYVEGENEIEFSEEYPFQSAYINLTQPAVYTIGAKPSEGWKFVKWTLNGEDYSTEPVFTTEFNSDAELIAVFEEE